MQSFPEAFREGMAARARQLGDEGVNDPQNWDQSFGKGQVHIGLSVFSDSEEKHRRVLAIASERYKVLRRQRLGHTGFRRAARRPQLTGLQRRHRPAIDRGQQPRAPAGRARRSRPGSSSWAIRVRQVFPLPMPQPDILGRNGTYVGFRKYQTRVGAFNRFLHANGPTLEERELLAAKLVGRWRSGAPLTLAPDVDNPALGADPHRNNDFNYSNDPRGRQAPFGCHIRRMNPRDTKLTRLTHVNLHRIIRRGTTYGPPYDPNALSEADDEIPRGAYFLFISAKAMDTIEFLQQEWINDGNFIGIGGERDPIIGRQDDDAIFTIPREPVRHRVHGIETFNVLRGGEYFFMPSLSALKWIGELG